MAIAFLFLPASGIRAYAQRYVAYVTEYSWRGKAHFYKDLQSAINAVEDNQTICLRQNIVAPIRGFVVNRGKSFRLDLNGFNIENPWKNEESVAITVDNNGGSLIIDDRTPRHGKIGAPYGAGIRLESGKLVLFGDAWYDGKRSIDVYGGEMDVHRGNFFHSVVVNNPGARIAIQGGEFEPRAGISAKGKNACSLTISGGLFFGKVTNTGKRRFITGGTFHYSLKPAAKYIHPDYCLVKTTVSKYGKTEDGWRVEKKPPSTEETDTPADSEDSSGLRQRVEAYRDQHEG